LPECIVLKNDGDVAFFRPEFCAPHGRRRDGPQFLSSSRAFFRPDAELGRKSAQKFPELVSDEIGDGGYELAKSACAEAATDQRNKDHNRKKI